MVLLQSIKLDGFLSFPPESEAIALTPLNVLIGPNGSGKSNLLEAIEVLHATPTALANLVREGGTATEWIWKGEPLANHAKIEVVIAGPQKGLSPRLSSFGGRGRDGRGPRKDTGGTQKIPSLRYSLDFAPTVQRFFFLHENIVVAVMPATNGKKDEGLFYRFAKAQAALSVKE